MEEKGTTSRRRTRATSDEEPWSPRFDRDERASESISNSARA